MSAPATGPGEEGADDTDMVAADADGAAAAPDAAADIPSVISQLTAGLSWASVSQLLRQLAKELSTERSELPRLHAPLLDVAQSALRRAGVAGERAEACKSVVSRCRRDLEMLVTKEEQLGLLLAALQKAQNDAARGELKHDQDWGAYIKKATEEAQVHTTDQCTEHSSSLPPVLRFSHCCLSGRGSVFVCFLFLRRPATIKPSWKPL
jgi:hypothetical protein